MNQQLVAEFSALVAVHAPLIIEGTMPLEEGPLWVYWQHGKTLWPRRKRELEALCAATDSNSHSDRTSQIMKTASDLLVGELLTRIAGAVLTACDRQQRLQRAEPIARNILRFISSAEPTCCDCCCTRRFCRPINSANSIACDVAWNVGPMCSSAP